jgi:hypothetical protein
VFFSGLRSALFENMVSKKVFDQREVKCGENCIMRGFITCALRQVYLKWSNQGGCHGQGM